MTDERLQETKQAIYKLIILAMGVIAGFLIGLGQAGGAK